MTYTSAQLLPVLDIIFVSLFICFCGKLPGDMKTFQLTVSAARPLTGSLERIGRTESPKKDAHLRKIVHLLKQQIASPISRGFVHAACHGIPLRLIFLYKQVSDNFFSLFFHLLSVLPPTSSSSSFFSPTWLITSREKQFVYLSGLKREKRSLGIRGDFHPSQ